MGYCAQNLKKKLSSNWKVLGTHQDDFLNFNSFEDITHVLISIPPNEEGDPVFQRYLKKISNIKWLGYFSVTSVYGDTQGAWVQENSPTSCQSSQAKNRLKAENQWLSTNLPVHIFRLAAIYGPQRNIIERMLENKVRRFASPGQIFNRIHVDDIIQVLHASMLAPNPGAIYNLADDLPSTYEETLTYAAALLNIEPPKIETSESQCSNVGTRRVSNQKIKKELNIKLQYPSFKEGLSAICSELRNHH